MSLRPMQIMGLCCTECGQVLFKREEMATDKEIVETGIACGVIDPWTVQHVGSCPKCGQGLLAERAESTICKCGHDRSRHKKHNKLSPCMEKRCVCLKYREKEE